jgi:O-antigen/teichoic acid export membrane protein
MLKKGLKNIEEDSYIDIAKSTSILAGAQIIIIIVNIIRTKFAALFIGPDGSGSFSMYSSALSMILTFTGLGVTFSTIKFISESKNNKTETFELNKKLFVARKLFIYTGLIGMVLVVLFSKKLSFWIFGNTNYTLSFILLSTTILLQSITNGELAVLQGMQDVKKLAKSNLAIALIGVLFTIPLFYFFRIKGIVPSIIITAVIGLLISKYNTNFLKTINFKLSLKELFTSGFDMIKLGATVTATNLFLAIVGFLTQLFIKNESGFVVVGLYTSGLSLISGYIGIIFTAMTTDFFPRLSANSSNFSKTNKLVNQQAEFSILILGPILMVLLFYLPLVIKILYTVDFLPAISFIQFSIVGVLFQAASWPIGILIASKGKLKFYFYLVMFSHLLSLITNLLFYSYFKLVGLGYAFLLTHILILMLSIILSNIVLKFKFENEYVKIFIFQFSLIIISFSFIKYFGYPSSYLIALPFCMLSVMYSFSKLKRKLNFTIIKSKYFFNLSFFNK